MNSLEKFDVGGIYRLSPESAILLALYIMPTMSKSKRNHSGLGLYGLDHSGLFQLLNLVRPHSKGTVRELITNNLK
jgi:hypothetical protein